MNSPTHTLLALAVLSKNGLPARNRAIFLGSLIPDAFIYIGWVWLTFIRKEPQERIWNEIYFDAPMQLVASIFNSVPIYAALALAGYFLIKSRWGLMLSFFALAALLHIATDFPVHNHDAYAHFWPLSDWRFISPFSYYEQDHHGRLVSLIETVIALICIAVLWRRFPKRWVRFVLGFFALLYIALQILIRLAPAGGAG